MNMFILTCAPFNKTLMYVRFDLWYLNYQLTLKVYCVSVIDTATLIVRLLIFDICILWLSHWVGDWLRPLCILWLSHWVGDWLRPFCILWLSHWVGDWLRPFCILWLSHWVGDWLRPFCILWLSRWVGDWLKPFCILWLSHWVGDWLRPLTSNHKPNAVDVSSVCFFNLSSLSLPPSNRNKSGGRDTDEYYWKWRDDKYQ
jgi:hypothetical protein